MNVALPTNNTGLDGSTTSASNASERCFRNHIECHVSSLHQEGVCHSPLTKRRCSNAGISSAKEMLKGYQRLDHRRNRRLRGEEEEVYFCLRRKQKPINEEGDTLVTIGDERDDAVPTTTATTCTGRRASFSGKMTADNSKAPDQVKVLQLQEKSVYGSFGLKKQNNEITVDFSPTNGSPRKIVKRPSQLDTLEECIGLRGIKAFMMEQWAIEETPKETLPRIHCSDGVSSMALDLKVASQRADEERSTCLENSESGPKKSRQVPGRTHSAPLRLDPSRVRSRNFNSPVRFERDNLVMMMDSSATESTIDKLEEAKPANSFPSLLAPRMGESLTGDRIDGMRVTPKAQARRERRRRQEFEGESLQQLLKDLKRTSTFSHRRCKSHLTEDIAATSSNLRGAASDDRSLTNKANVPLIPSRELSVHTLTPPLKRSFYGNEVRIKDLEVARCFLLSRSISTPIASQGHLSVRSFASAVVETKRHMNVDITVIDDRSEGLKSRLLEQPKFLANQQPVLKRGQTSDSIEAGGDIQRQAFSYATSVMQSQCIRQDFQRSPSALGSTASLRIDPFVASFIGIVEEELTENRDDVIPSQDVDASKKSQRRQLVRVASIFRCSSRICSKIAAGRRK